MPMSASHGFLDHCGLDTVNWLSNNTKFQIIQNFNFYGCNQHAEYIIYNKIQNNTIIKHYVCLF